MRILKSDWVIDISYVVFGVAQGALGEVRFLPVVDHAVDDGNDEH